MNKRFDVGGVIAAASPAVFRLFNSTDNPTYYTADGSSPTGDQWLSGLTATAYGAFKLELGLCDSDKGNFAPYYTTYSTLATSGGLVKKFDEDQPDIPCSATRLLALRITVFSDSTVYAAGDADLRAR